MRVPVDSRGRIVIPKEFRDELGLRGGEALEVVVRGGRLEIDVAPTPMTLERRGKGVVAEPERAVPALTADAVRETMEHVRR